MAYGLPGYRKDGKVAAGFASQKNYISLYVLKEEIVNAHRDQLRNANVGKGLHQILPT